MRRKTFTLACGALALALGAAAEEQGRVLGVRAHGDDRSSSVEIEGDRPLSFTTMKLLSPPRVVVDFADAEIAVEDRELDIDDGTLRRAALAQAGSRTARVVIELAVDAEFDVRADGNRVEVRVPRPGAVATADAPADGEAEKVASLPKVSLVGSKPAQPPEDAAASRPRTAAEKAEALKKALAERRRREAEEKAARKLARKGGGKMTMKQPPQPAADTSAGATAKSVASAAAETPSRAAKAPASPPGEPQPTQAAETPPSPGAQTPPSLAAEAPARAAADAPARSVAEAPARSAAEAPARPAVEATARPAVEAPARSAVEAPARPAAEAPARPGAEAPEMPARSAAAAPADRREEPAVAPPHQRPQARGHRITGIGFRPVRGGEVIVRSDQPLEYGVSDDASVVLLHLPSAAIPLPNNRRPLDTRFFGGAVQRVVPMPVPGGTDVRIELREHAEYQLAQTGSVLTVTFSAPQ